MSGIKNLHFKREPSLKIIISEFFTSYFYIVKTLPYTLLLYGKKGTADFGRLYRYKNPILPCGLVAWA